MCVLYVHVCTVYMYVCMYVHVCMYVVRMYVHLYVSTCMYICMYVCTYVYMYTSEFLIRFEAWAKLAQQWLVCVPLGIHLEPISKELMLLVII